MDAGIEVRVIHNASIMNAVASCGLQLYKFGYTVSIPFWTETEQTDSYFDKVIHNARGGFHTLCLLGEEGSWMLAQSRHCPLCPTAAPSAPQISR